MAAREPGLQPGDAKTTHPQTDDHPAPGPSGSGTETVDTEENWHAGLCRTQRVYGRLLDLYIMSDHYEAQLFRREIMLQWQRFTFRAPRFPGLVVVQRAIENLSIESSHCRYMTACFSRMMIKNSSQNTLAKLPPLFAAAILNRMLLNLRRPMARHASYETYWCKYHDHVDTLDRKSCQNARAACEDPDTDDIL
ncbi:hypothetical protein PV05_09648 [Exophiala xenobiotica]|uniref:Uncharacterized protein n=1 Tax=Exophiala xenobiotica TaxID=348802 RepID=A0A0D2CLX6_9EURO|nr:uncharacterized protein PV05_09648 [Exophiala xenobiotica]KIW50867.1 hypothetical protein PV05_09648 [Exophiala xenobiotica]